MPGSAIAAVTAVLVVLTGVLTALVFAVGLSVIDAVRRSARPHDAVLGWVESLGRYADVSLHRSARVVPGLVVYRLDDRLFFANATYFEGRVREALRGAGDSAKWLVLNFEGTTHVDATGLDTLASLTQALAATGIQICLARVKAPMAEKLATGGIIELVGPGRLYGTVRAAVDACAEASSASSGPSTIATARPSRMLTDRGRVWRRWSQVTQPAEPRDRRIIISSSFLVCAWW